MRSLPNILPSVKFPNFGILPAFPVFLGKKRGKFGQKTWKKKAENLEKKVVR